MMPSLWAAGLAGLAAAIYLGRAQYRVLVIEKEKIGGQITITSEVVNYPGVPKTDGKKLTEAMRKQAQYFGAEFLLAEVKELKLKGDKKYAVTDKGETEGLAILLATGASPRKAGFKGEMEFTVERCVLCDVRRRIFHRKRRFCGRRRICGGGGSDFPDAVCKESENTCP